MRKLLLVSLLTLSSTLFASPNIGISVQSPIGNNSMIDINFRSDDHRYDNRYKNFDYNRHGYRDDFGYYFGYFDKTGYFYNNIFFLYDNKYTYRDRLYSRGYFKPNHVHYREYRFHKNNDWNRLRNYRKDREPVYGPYYQKIENNYYINDKQRYKDHKNEIKREEKRDKDRYKDNHKKNYDRKSNDRDYKNDRNSQRRDDHNHR